MIQIPLSKPEHGFGAFVGGNLYPEPDAHVIPSCDAHVGTGGGAGAGVISASRTMP
tara:strand:+ start:381 stop:548 length:168 start_codon:yes stop_codon:yes gene_type:complete